MALFPGDLGSYTTPDGRSVTMPAGLASSFPALQPAAPLPIPSAPQPAPLTDADRADLAAAAATAQAPTPAGGPITLPEQAPAGAGPGGPRGPVTSPAAATDAGPANPPAQPRVTNDQIAKMGLAGGVNAELSAQESQRAAARQLGEAQADQATTLGNIMAEADAHAARQLEERKRLAEENVRQQQAFTTEIVGRAKKLADLPPVDRSADHPLLAAISAALVGAGQAWNRQEVDAMKPVYQAIDRKVAAQMHDRDRQMQGLGLLRDAMSVQRQTNMDRLAENDTYRLASIEQARRRADTIKQQTMSPIIRAQADAMIADFDQKSAQIIAGAQERWQQQRNVDQARQVQIRGQNMEQARFEVSVNEARQARADEIAARFAERGIQMDMERLKLIRETALVDPSTGDLMLTPAGQQKMAQADQYEAQARKSDNPTQAQKLNQQAQLLRDSARINDVATAVKKEAADKAQGVVNVAQNLVNNVDLARRMLKAGPEAWNRDEWAAIQVALTNVKVNYAQQTGERMSVGALEAMDHVLSLNPDSLFSRTVDKEKALKALDTIETGMRQSADVAVRNSGVKSGWSPSRRDTAAPTFDGKTAAEVGKDAEPGWAGAIRDKVAPGTVNTEAVERAFGRTNAKGQSSAYGLAPETDDTVRGLIERAGGAGHGDYSRIVESLAVPLTRISGDGARPTLASGVARLIRDEDPKLYQAVLARLPEIKAKEIEAATTPVPGAAAPSPRAPTSLGRMSPAEKRKYNEYLRSAGLPEVR